MPTFHDNCSDTANWANISGEFASDGEDISVSSWHSLSELSAVAQAYVHLLDDAWTLQSNFDFTIEFDTRCGAYTETIAFYLEFGNRSTNKWAFWINTTYGFFGTYSNNNHTLRCVLRAESRTEYYMDIYIDGVLAFASINLYSYRSYLIKDVRIQITHSWGEWG